MAVWLCDSHAGHIMIPTRLEMWSRWPQAKHTIFRFLSVVWVREPMPRGRIGLVDKQRKVIPGWNNKDQKGLFPIAETRTTQGLLLLKHALSSKRSELQ